MGRPELTDAERERALALRAAGHSLEFIARHFGVGRKWLSYRLTPEQKARERDLARVSSAELRAERRRAADRARRQQRRDAAMVPAPVAFVFSPASRAEARRLHRDKHLPLTHIAAALRMPYREVIAAIEGTRAP